MGCSSRVDGWVLAASALAAAALASVASISCSRRPARAPAGTDAVGSRGVSSDFPSTGNGAVTPAAETPRRAGAAGDGPGTEADAPGEAIAAKELPHIPDAAPPAADGGIDGWEAVMLGEAVGRDRSKEPGRDPAPPPASGGPGRSASRPRRATPRIVVYPFESGFDDGELGAKVARVVTGHAERTKLFETLPRVTQDEILAARPFAAKLDANVTPLARHARDAFDADVAVWGKVEGGRDKPVISVKAVDLRGGNPASGAAPELVLAESYRCANIHLIPAYADEIVSSLVGRRVGTRTRAGTVKALSGNLLANGDFSKGLAGWSPNFPEHASARRGRLVFDIPEDIAAGHGMDALSDYVPAEPGAHYELALRVRSHGPSAITWVKGYAEFPPRDPGERVIDRRREVFRHQMRPASQAEPGPDGWIRVTTKPFRFRHPRFEAKWMRVKLYGYWPKGKVEFDDVVLRKVQVEGETAEEEDDRMRRAYEGKDPNEAVNRNPPPASPAPSPP